MKNKEWGYFWVIIGIMDITASVFISILIPFFHQNRKEAVFLLLFVLIGGIITGLMFIQVGYNVGNIYVNEETFKKEIENLKKELKLINPTKEDVQHLDNFKVEKKDFQVKQTGVQREEKEDESSTLNSYFNSFNKKL